VVSFRVRGESASYLRRGNCYSAASYRKGRKRGKLRLLRGGLKPAKKECLFNTGVSKKEGLLKYIETTIEKSGVAGGNRHHRKKASSTLGRKKSIFSSGGTQGGEEKKSLRAEGISLYLYH